VHAHFSVIASSRTHDLVGDQVDGIRLRAGFVFCEAMSSRNAHMQVAKASARATPRGGIRPRSGRELISAGPRGCPGRKDGAIDRGIGGCAEIVEYDAA
jgi:hypothetical protein